MPTFTDRTASQDSTAPQISTVPQISTAPQISPASQFGITSQICTAPLINTTLQNSCKVIPPHSSVQPHR